MSDVALPAQRRRRWLIAGLVASLAVNAFFVGALATDWLDIGWGNRSGGRVLNFELRWLHGHLPDEGMDRVAAAVDAARPTAEGHYDRLKELRRSLGTLAAVPAPDRAAIDARLVEIRAEIDRMLTDLQRTSMDALLALPPEMRSQLAEDDKQTAR
jgi:uncharacterized membrane protein